MADVNQLINELVDELTEERAHLLLSAIMAGRQLTDSYELDERDQFNTLVATVGTMLRAPRVEFTSTLVPDGSCWTGAWNEARYHGGDYVEGMVIAADGRLHRAHAWVERVDSSGERYVVEATEGYDRIVTYLGYRMSAAPDSPADRATAAFDFLDLPGGRYSVIEWLVCSGWHISKINTHLSSPEVTP